MCGKFTQMASWSEVVSFSNLLPARPGGDGDAGRRVTTPMREAFVVRLDADGVREAVPMRWGLPHPRGSRTAANAPTRGLLMHARSETIERTPVFAEAFARRRGAIFVDSFNEGEEVAAPGRRPRTRQWTARPRDHRPLILAVVYARLGAADASGAAFAFVQATAPANARLGAVAERMPCLLDPDDLPVWLGERPAPTEAIKALLRTREGEDWEFAPERAMHPGGAAAGSAAVRDAGAPDRQGQLF